MYLEKARNVSALSYGAHVSVTRVLTRPVPLDCTALLLVSCHFPLITCPAGQASGVFPGQSCGLSLSPWPQIKPTHGFIETF